MALRVGPNLATGQQCRMSADGRLLAVSEADNGPDGYPDYAIPVEGGGTTLSLPRGMSGRVYLAIGQKLKFRANPGNALAYPAGWVDRFPPADDRAAAFSALASQPGFGGLVLENGLRAIAPGHGLAAGRFAADLLAGYVEEV